jgi:hypothetical protein
MVDGSTGIVAAAGLGTIGLILYWTKGGTFARLGRVFDVQGRGLVDDGL